MRNGCDTRADSGLRNWRETSPECQVARQARRDDCQSGKRWTLLDGHNLQLATVLRPPGGVSVGHYVRETTPPPPSPPAAARWLACHISVWPPGVRELRSYLLVWPVQLNSDCPTPHQGIGIWGLGGWRWAGGEGKGATRLIQNQHQRMRHPRSDGPNSLEIITKSCSSTDRLCCAEYILSLIHI